MSINKAKAFFFAAIISILSASAVTAQVTSQTSSGRSQEVPSEALQTDARVDGVLRNAGNFFRQGVIGLKDGDKKLARENFDKAIETILMADIKAPKITGCLNQLGETIFRLEYPSGAQRPEISQLANTCGWSIDEELSATVTRSAIATGKQTTEEEKTFLVAQGGFTEQKHEVSQLDELAKLVLTTEETDLSNPVAQEQYQLIETAVSNKSLGFSFQVHPMIQQFVNYYQGRGRTTMATGLYRSGMFMRMARRIFKEEGVPENVAWLGQVESAWKPSALSWASASGLWQFIPGTAERFGLRRTSYVDERNGFEAATRASARYLKFLANRYGGNWELAMAAYNSGEGNVDRAISRAGVANFWVAYPYLPQETRNYVPNILATILIANNPNQYGFGQVRPAAPLLYDRVKVPALTSLGFIAQAADTTVEYLRYLNPELRSNTTPPESYIVRVPPTKGNEVLAMFKKVPSGSRGDASVVASVAGESWQNVSNRTGISVEDLRAANPGMAIPQGKVIVPVSANVTKTTYQRPSTPNVVAVTTGVRTVKVKKGDTLIKLASQYGVTPSEVANLNGLSSVDAPLQLGRELKIPVK